jgi:hypothetical protein
MARSTASVHICVLARYDNMVHFLGMARSYLDGTLIDIDSLDQFGALMDAWPGHQQVVLSRT